MKKKKRTILWVILGIGILLAGLQIVRSNVGMEENSSVSDETEEIQQDMAEQSSEEVLQQEYQQQEFQEAYLEQAVLMKSMVHIAMRETMGSGIIWEITKDSVVIVSNKHLLQEDVEAEVVFWNGLRLRGKVIGLSPQHDVGFLQINLEENIEVWNQQEVPEEKLAEVTVSKRIESEDVWTQNTFLGEPVIQLSMPEANAVACYEGYVCGKEFIENLYDTMLITACYSKAGMSGGAVFNQEGVLLGMITGGEIEPVEGREGTGAKREADITYSIPSFILEEEYHIVKG